MYASVTTVQSQPGKLEEGLSIWRDSLAPLIKELPGFKGLYVLTNPDKGKAMSVVLYETEADAEATQTSGKFQEYVAMFGATIVPESVVRDGYEVSLQV